MMRDSFLQNPTLNLLLPLPKLSGDSAAAAAAAGDYSLSDQFSSDDFRMYAFKVRRCTRGRSHDWTDCPFAHSGEKARRRDPRNHHYSAVSCPDFRKGTCKKGDACEFAHGVFECWLHPARYRTQICKDGRDCRRRVCFFAHSPEQVRVLPVVLQQRSLISPASSPPVVEEIVASIGSLWLGRVGGEFKQGFCGVSPAAVAAVAAAEVVVVAGEEDEGLVRVESGRGLRVKMYERLSRMGLGGAEFDPAGQSGPDFGWVSELIK